MKLRHVLFPFWLLTGAIYTIAEWMAFGLRSIEELSKRRDDTPRHSQEK